ncbi:MAG: hypothetical protein R3C19_09790 [Planctomycetaceae bacterium]
MASLDSGDPFLLEGSRGEGVVVQMATACDADWSDLPLRPFFVPLMQQLVTTLGKPLAPPRNIRTGEPVVVLFDAAKDAAAADHPLSIVTPSGGRRTLRAVPEGNRLVARFEHTNQPGQYALSASDGGTIHFVASTSREESDLSVMDESRLSSLAESLHAELASSAREFLERDRLRRHGREIWKLVLIALLVFMFLELVLQQRFSRVRT